MLLQYIQKTQHHEYELSIEISALKHKNMMQTYTEHDNNLKIELLEARIYALTRYILQSEENHQAELQNKDEEKQKMNPH